MVPLLPLSGNLTCIGDGAVVLRRHSSSSSYLLAELATTPRLDLPDAELHLWMSDAPAGQWDTKAVRLPCEVSRETGKHLFTIDASFSLGTSTLCWADLLHGIVVCHDPAHQDPHFRFIPLPNECPAVDASDADYPYRPRVRESRSVACVGGVIKLVSMVGLLERLDISQFKLVTRTLSPDLGEWKETAVFHLRDLWASDAYLALKLPKQTPVCPLLGASPDDDDAVYAIVNDVEMRNIVKGSEVVKTKVDGKGQYVLQVDMQRNKIISTAHGVPPPSWLQLVPGLLATDFTAYLQGGKDRQRELEAGEVGESGKRMKLG